MLLQLVNDSLHLKVGLAEDVEEVLGQVLQFAKGLLYEGLVYGLEVLGAHQGIVGVQFHQVTEHV